MLPFVRICLLWVALVLSSHSVLGHFWLGRVAETTLSSGLEPIALRFYGYLATFGICAYYFCKEIEVWRKGMPFKVVVCALAAILFLLSLSGLESLDANHYREMEQSQRDLIAGRLGVQASELDRYFSTAVSLGASPEEVFQAFPDSLPSELHLRRDGTAYQNVFYWLGPGTLPVGAQISYSTPPHRVTAVEALPRVREFGPMVPQSSP